jgi:cell wall assembly regulator SMI1
MKRIWDRIHVWLAANAPAVLASLRPGASEEAIRAAERAMGVTLPDDVKAAYRIHDGQGGADGRLSMPPGFLYGYEWHTLEELVLRWTTLSRSVEYAIPTGWWPTTDGIVRAEWHHPAWIPLAGSPHGDHDCADLAPDDHGEVGQIIDWRRHKSERLIQARSFTRWLERFADELEAGRWVYSEDHYRLLEDWAGEP